MFSTDILHNFISQSDARRQQSGRRMCASFFQSFTSAGGRGGAAVRRAYPDKSRSKKSKETLLMGARSGWIKACPAVFQMIANHDLKATLPPEVRILNPISARYRDANIVAAGLQSAGGAVGIIEWLPR